MDGLEAGGHLENGGQGFGLGQTPGMVGQGLVQILPGQNLHRDIGERAFLAVVVDAADVGMGDLARQFDLGPESPQGLLVGGQVGPQNLDGHFLFQKPVEGSINQPHSSLAEHASQFVPGRKDRANGRRSERSAADGTGVRARLDGRGAGRTLHGHGMKSERQ